ncbi:MAG: tRNA lysidine(34) synthetase TilS [Actinomycetota bacterium]
MTPVGRGARWSVDGGPGFGLAEKLAETAARYRMIAGGDSILVAVSGGPDSMCLLHALGRLGADLTLNVAHVDHGLSDASEEISAMVAKWAAEAGHDVHVARAKDLEGPNLHARARAFRYSFFETIARDVGASLIATGHTLDDRVETTLARLIHGAGTEGLAGLPPSAGNRIRPLIEVRRKETRAYCEEAAIPFIDDPANEDPRFDRGSVRALVLRPIEERWGEGAVRAMASSAGLLREDAAALASQAQILYDGMVEDDDDGARLINLESLLALPRALRRRILETAVGRLRDRAGGIDAALDALDRDHKPGARFDLPGEASIVIEREQVVVKGPLVKEPGE